MISFLCQLHIFLAFVRILDNLLFLKCYSMVGWSVCLCVHAQDGARSQAGHCMLGAYIFRYVRCVSRDGARSSIDEHWTFSNGRKTNKRTIKCCSISFSCETPEGTVLFSHSIFIFSQNDVLLLAAVFFSSSPSSSCTVQAKKYEARTCALALCVSNNQVKNIIMEDAWPKFIDIVGRQCRLKRLASNQRPNIS